jgi:hypothetical protein
MLQGLGTLNQAETGIRFLVLLILQQSETYGFVHLVSPDFEQSYQKLVLSLFPVTYRFRIKFTAWAIALPP